MNNFIHLHCHSEYSQLDGLGSAEQYVSRAKEMGFEYLALTDHGNVSGCIKWQNECKKQGIKPIIGSELYIVPSLARDLKSKAGHITILVKNIQGWQELCRMLTIANLEGFHSKSKIDFEILESADLSGLIIMTGCAGSFLKLKGGVDHLAKLQELGAELYLEIMPHCIEVQASHHKIIKQCWEKFQIPLIATNDCHYPKRGDSKAQEVLLAIARKSTWNNPQRWSFGFHGLHLRSANEMIKSFERQGDFTEQQVREAMERTIEVAKKCCDFQIPKMEIALPDAPGTEGKDANQILDNICKQKLECNQPTNIYFKRYQHEFKLIKKKGFAQYFLIVHDIVRYCKEADIEIGPCRGSVGGSLIAYLLGITKTDPIKFDLSFSRFLNEDRGDWPDIDIDFEKRYRDKVRVYIENTYGRDFICGISTPMRLKSRAVLWDIRRVFELPEKYIKDITNVMGDNSLRKTLDDTNEGQKFVEKHPDEARLALKLENQLRNFGQHPAAVIISSENLKTGKRGSLRFQKDSKGKKTIVSCWDMQDSEYVGLMKLDILGLSTLSVLAECESLIQDIPLERFDLDNIPLNDKKVFESLSTGDAVGVFQIGTPAGIRLIKDTGIESFRDIVDNVALVRPGPMNSKMTENYIKRKHGAKWEPKHEIYEEITKDTFGIIIYQEQVMQVISRVAGLPESTADKIRKVIGKKREVKEFEPYRIQFIEGCKKQKTLSLEEANEFWEGLKEHASYSFNKSHSVGYALIAYQTCWLKQHYPAEFICACLTHDEKTNKQDLINEAHEHGLKVMSPKVNISQATDWVLKNNTLYMPFTEINGIGESQAKKYCTRETQTQEGFFNIRAIPKSDSQIGIILRDIKANEPEVIVLDEIMKKYISFSLKPSIKKDSLIDVVGFNLPKQNRLPKNI